MRRTLLLPLVAILAGFAGGCASARARTVPELPALEPPLPPPRLIQPLDFKANDTAPAEDPDARPPSTVKPPPADRARTEKPKPDPSKEATPPKVEGPVEGPKPLPEVAKPPLLQTAETSPGAGLEMERNIHRLLGQAEDDLYRKGVDYTRLNADGKSQYDTAKRFIEQARQALGERNLVYAAKLADKAATLARLLPR